MELRLKERRNKRMRELKNYKFEDVFAQVQEGNLQQLAQAMMIDEGNRQLPVTIRESIKQ